MVRPVTKGFGSKPWQPEITGNAATTSVQPSKVKNPLRFSDVMATSPSRWRDKKPMTKNHVLVVAKMTLLALNRTY
jgi:hypothetical protein